MKLVLTGSLGHIGKPLTADLVKQGHDVIVISSNAEKQKDIEALGATAAIGNIEDVDFLATTFTGADAVYTMLPPPQFSDPTLDLMELCKRTGNNYAKAIQRSGVKRVVHLSSIGAHMHKDSGLILLHRAVEDILEGLNDVAITFMRPVAFHYNLYSFIPVIKNAGMIASNYGAEDVVAWVAPADIADAIADEIITSLTGRKVRYIASDELTCNEVASILGEAIGKPDLKWLVIPNEQMQQGMEAAGVAPAVAAGLVEMNACMHSGTLFADYYKNRPVVMGKIKMTEFAKDFAKVFNQ